jgi:hypothetical protein
MNSFNNAVFIILIIIIILLIVSLKVVWDLFATSITLKLLKNNSGNYSSSKIIIWGLSIMMILFLLNHFSKRQTIRPSLTRSEN